MQGKESHYLPYGMLPINTTRPALSFGAMVNWLLFSCEESFRCFFEDEALGL